VYQRAATQQLSAKVFKLSFEYLHIFSPKSGDFCRKKQQNCIINVLSKVIFTENIEIQPQPRFTGYSMNALDRDFYRRPNIGGGAATPIGHWRSGSETDTPTMSFGVGLFVHRPLRRYFLLQLLIEY